MADEERNSSRSNPSSVTAAEKAENEPAQSSKPSSRDGSPKEQQQQQQQQQTPSQAQQSAAAAAAAEQADEGEAKPTLLQRFVKTTGLDAKTCILMFKASIPPTIAIAMFQADAVAAEYSTQGYLIAILSVIGFCIIPRAKHLQMLVLNLFTTCFGASTNLLAIYCAVKAREHTTPPGTPVGAQVPYNSSASAVSALWLIIQIYFLNSVRSWKPQLAFPAIIYTIFSVVSMTYAPTFANMDSGLNFIKSLLKTFLTGFGLSTAVSLLIIPISYRTVVFGEMTEYLEMLQAVMRAQCDYMQSLEFNDMFVSAKPVSKDGDEEKHHHLPGSHAKPAAPATTAFKTKAEKLSATFSGLLALHGKLTGDIPFAKREITYGKLRPSHIDGLFDHMRNVSMPLFGLTSVMDLIDRMSAWKGWDQMNDETTDEDERWAVQTWHDMMAAVHEPFVMITNAMSDGLEHVLLVLEFKKKPKTSDPEKDGDGPRPGSPEFAAYFDRKTHEFYHDRAVTLREWCQTKGLDNHHDALATLKAQTSFLMEHGRELDKGEFARRQLFIVLYVEYILWAASREMLKLIQWTDEKVEDGTMKKKKFMVPGTRALKKWVKHALASDDGGLNDDENFIDHAEQQPAIVYGAGFGPRPDPEHLPPTTTLQKIGDSIRGITHALRSKHSVFGFRACCAVMTLAVVAYLHDTQTFFLRNRLMWAVVMPAFGMARTSGAAVFGFAARIMGTAVAMVACYVIWYIVVGHTAGVIVFLWLWIGASFYVPLKYPAFASVGILMVITSILIIGYELQTEKVGVAVAEANGQAAYPVYILAPYRLATVICGIAVGYIWTVFPYPINETSELRHNLGSSFNLLASYYSIVHQTVIARVRGNEGNLEDPNSPGHRLAKVRAKYFVSTHTLIDQLKEGLRLTKLQFQMGGKFPKESYDLIISRISRVNNYIALISYASHTFSAANTDPEKPEKISQWHQRFRQVANDMNDSSHEIGSVLTLLGAAIYNGTPLPPNLKAPEPFKMVKEIETLDAEVLHIKHIDEPGYAAIAVMQLAVRSIIVDLTTLMDEVKKLVGEQDYSYNINDGEHAQSSDSLLTSSTDSDKSTSKPSAFA